MKFDRVSYVSFFSQIGLIKGFNLLLRIFEISFEIEINRELIEIPLWVFVFFKLKSISIDVVTSDTKLFIRCASVGKLWQTSSVNNEFQFMCNYTKLQPAKRQSFALRCQTNESRWSNNNDIDNVNVNVKYETYAYAVQQLVLYFVIYTKNLH